MSVGLDSRSSPFFPFSSPTPNSHPLHHSTSLSTLFKPSLMVELEKTPSADLSRQLSRAQSHPSIRHGFPLHSFFDPYLDPERVSSNGTVVEDGSGVIHVRLSPSPFMAGMRASGSAPQTDSLVGAERQVEFELNDCRDPMSFSNTRFARSSHFADVSWPKLYPSANLSRLADKTAKLTASVSLSSLHLQGNGPSPLPLLFSPSSLRSIYPRLP